LQSLLVSLFNRLSTTGSLAFSVSSMLARHLASADQYFSPTLTFMVCSTASTVARKLSVLGPANFAT
jgi:hypothetical protein